MKTDPIFYRLFKDFPVIFFELIGLPAEEASIYQFNSFEVKQSAFRIDGLFIPIEANHPLYFVEVQFRYDAKIYARVFSEIFIYLNQNDSSQDWRSVIIYDTRSHEPRNLVPYQELLNSAKVTRIYLDELPQEYFTSLNMRLIEFIITSQEVAIEKGKQLLADARQIDDETERIDIIELVEMLISCKFSDLSREELVKMFSLDEFKQSRLYQDIRREVLEESNLEVIAALAKRGFTVEEIAEIVKWDVKKVRQVVKKSQGE